VKIKEIPAYAGMTIMRNYSGFLLIRNLRSNNMFSQNGVIMIQISENFGVSLLKNNLFEFNKVRKFFNTITVKP